MTPVADERSSSSELRRRYTTYAAALLLVAFAVYLIGNNSLPLVDRDEPRYAQASRQMLESGDWTTPKFLDELRLKKPVGIYWLQAASMQVLGVNEFAARLPSAIATVLTLGLMLATLPRVIGHRQAWWATFIFATALLPTYLAKIGMTDAVLHLFIAIAMGCLYAIWRGEGRWPVVIALGLAVGTSLLIKGPPVFMFLGTTLVALWLINLTIREPSEELRVIDVERAVPRVAVKVVLAVAIAVAVVVPWILRLEAAHPGAVASMVMKEVVARGRSGQEGHAGPPGFYLLTLLGTYVPWSLLLPATLWRGWQRRREPWARFSLAAVLGPWLFLEIYRTKLPHYWLPSYPFLAILTAHVVIQASRGLLNDLRDGPFLLAAKIVGGIVTVGGLLVLILPWLGEADVWPSLLAGIALTIGLATACGGVAILFANDRPTLASLSMGLSLWAIVTFAASVYVPNTSSFTLARRVGETLRLRQVDRPGTARMINFKEPSIAFYQGGTIREESDGDYVRRVQSDHWPRWLVIDAATWNEQPERIRGRWREADRLRGLNLASTGLVPQTVLILENTWWRERAEDPNIK